MKKTTLIFAAVVIYLLGMAPIRAEAPPQATVLTYVAEWGVPRAQWGEMAKQNESELPLLDRLMEDGTIVGYGFYESQAHSEDGMTHGS